MEKQELSPEEILELAGILEKNFPYIGKEDKRVVAIRQLTDWFEAKLKAQLAKVQKHYEPKIEVLSEVLFRLLARLGVVSKDAIPTSPQLLMVAEEYLKQKRLDRPDVCPECKGAGETPTYNDLRFGYHHTCPTCKGTGIKDKPDRDTQRKEKLTNEEMMKLPMSERHKILDEQVKQFAKDNPNYPDRDGCSSGEATCMPIKSQHIVLGTGNRPDREKIAEFLYSENEPTLIYDGITFDKCREIYPEKVEGYLEQADQILALFPDEAEIRRQLAKEIEIYLDIVGEGKLDGWLAWKETEDET